MASMDNVPPRTPGPDECDRCFRKADLYYNERTGDALCDKCDAADEAPDLAKLLTLKGTLDNLLEGYRERRKTCEVAERHAHNRFDYEDAAVWAQRGDVWGTVIRDLEGAYR